MFIETKQNKSCNKLLGVEINEAILNLLLEFFQNLFGKRKSQEECAITEEQEHSPKKINNFF